MPEPAAPAAAPTEVAPLVLAGRTLRSRLIVGTGKYADAATMSAPRPLEARYRARRAAGCYLRELPSETVVYDPATHEICVLNPVAAYIFGLCDGAHTVADMLVRLSDRYDAPADVLERDLGRTLRELAAKRLIS